MRAFLVSEKHDGRRLDRWIASELPLLPRALMQKYLRQKKFTRDGIALSCDVRLAKGDRIEADIPEEFFEKPAPRDALLESFRPHLRVLYEDANVLLADKQPGLIAHPDREEKVNTLLTHVRAYLYQKGEYDPDFKPVLCNRIDRFTGGIVIAAKNAVALRDMNILIRERLIDKRYLAVIHGAMNPPEGVLDSYILQRQGMRRVLVRHAPEEGAKRAVTEYTTLWTRNGLSLVDCLLRTGRTHQIRAQFADAGHPLLGDTQYGDPKDEAQFGRGYQALYAYGLDFAFEPYGGALDALSGLSVRVPLPFAPYYYMPR
ncbi:MAG: RluA family pseudouridine synthase [Christensenellales bacterium]|jgi:23S rRNA pseudouridine955/2504/2580 synthase